MTISLAGCEAPSSTQLSQVASDWSSSSGANPPTLAQGPTPDGDNIFVRTHPGANDSKFIVTSPGDHTIPDSARSGLKFTCDWASNSNKGGRFVVKIGNDWYGSSPFGMTPNEHGAMTTDAVLKPQTLIRKTGTFPSADTLPAGMIGATARSGPRRIQLYQRETSNSTESHGSRTTTLTCLPWIISRLRLSRTTQSHPLTRPVASKQRAA